jgi:hypothetical protein
MVHQFLQQSSSRVRDFRCDGNRIISKHRKAPSPIEFKFALTFININRLRYSKKGYTDGEIGVEWIKQFDRYMEAKANRHCCLLLVDGHNSHYIYGFLQHVRNKQIHILCYP